MSFVSKEKTAPATWKVAAHITAEDFCKQVDITAAKEVQKITLPGFRPGKAPRSLVEKRFGADVFFEEALDALLPGAVDEAIKEAELEPQFRAENLEVQEMNKETGVDFTFTLAVRPEVTIADYKGIEVEVPSADVTDDDVDARIHELQHRNARRVEVEGRAAQDGDIAVIDFRGLLDGVAFDGGTAQNHELELGSGQFIPGFEAQVIGHNPGESFDVNVTFPEEYHAEDLAGKPVVFEVTLHELKCEELPEVDDDFAQEVGEDYNTVADLKAGIADELKDSKAKQAEDIFAQAVQEKLADMLEGEIPDAMYQRRAQQNVELFLDRIQIPMDRYLEITGEAQEDFMARMLAQSTGQVKVELALEKVAEAEGYAPTEEEIEAEQNRLAEQYNVPLAQVKFAVPQEEIVNDLNRAKALELVKAEAVKTEAKEVADAE